LTVAGSNIPFQLPHRHVLDVSPRLFLAGLPADGPRSHSTRIRRSLHFSGPLTHVCTGRGDMDRRVKAWIGMGALLALLVGSVQAQEAKKPDATLTLSEGSVAVGIGWSWGKGVLNYKGKSYPVKVEGLSVGEVGVTKAQARGDVFNLKRVEDFPGLYAAAGAEGT